MAKKIAISHKTDYIYDKPVQLGPQLIRLKPSTQAKAAIQHYQLTIEPRNHTLQWQTDPFGNAVARVSFPEKVQQFSVGIDCIANVDCVNPLAFLVDEELAHYPFTYSAELQESLQPYLQLTETTAVLHAFMANAMPSDQQYIIDCLSQIASHCQQNIDYEIRLQAGVQSISETLQRQKGSCRDMAWLLCQCLRSINLASRFCSGYLLDLDAKDDTLALHAWAEVYLPGAGWVGLDATSGLFTAEMHIPLCAAPSPQAAAPVTGTVEPCQSRLQTHMHAAAIAPKAIAQDWQAIDACGQTIDAALRQGNCPLTMGGEPTFVANDDREALEWQTGALGPDKRQRAIQLAALIRQQQSQQGVSQMAVGKHYPGEPTPRWALTNVWRCDQQPVWQQAQWLRQHSKVKVDLAKAKSFLQNLCQYLGLPDSTVLTGCEDQEYYDWQQKRHLSAPSDHPPTQQPTGYILPLHYSLKAQTWVTSDWQQPDKQLFLIPVEGEMGLRIPFASLPWQETEADECYQAINQFQQQSSLPNRSDLCELVNARRQQPVATEADFKQICTALCIEVTDQSLQVFIPPLEHASHYLELMVALELTCQQCQTPIQLTGYAPPRDRRLRVLALTPDPGVLEVNIPPAQSWSELVETYRLAYRQAELVDLCAYKYCRDGRQIGSGGGNHIIVGAATTESSPFLQRPDLVRSVVSFWQNHPSLSYLFSSIFVGPNSQAPRIDEARQDVLSELEIAFAQIPDHDQMPLWLVDRIFRNILVDVTGNTHRAEICADKLYHPDNESGRLGLLEFRGFEMPPKLEWCCLQALLVRACIATFWARPYHHKLIQWGTELHDKFMLPQFIWQDFCEVIDTLNLAGFPLQASWYQPLFDFRFPQYGQMQAGNVHVNLRMALEPWLVMGETSEGGSTSRPVDSSLERVQVKVRGLTNERYIITCNGRRLPLHATNEPGTFVAGVRFKACQLSQGLHASLPVHSPLTFAVIDTMYQQVVGQCVYDANDPEKRGYQYYPVTDAEAEQRRLARFKVIHKIENNDVAALPGEEWNTAFPYTLDLRR